MKPILSLTLILIMVTPLLAQTPGLTPSKELLIQGKGWSHGYSVQESLSCDLATSRAERQLANAISYAKAEQFVTTEALMIAILRPAQRIWENGQCIGKLELVVPILEQPATKVQLRHH